MMWFVQLGSRTVSSSSSSSDDSERGESSSTYVGRSGKAIALSSSMASECHIPHATCNREREEKEKEKEKGEVMVMVVVVIVVVAVKEEGKKGTTTAQRVKTRFRTAADSSAKGYLDSWDALDRLHQCGALNDDGQHGTVSQPPCNAVPRTLLLAQYAANMQHP
jgi:hypothetical protein